MKTETSSVVDGKIDLTDEQIGKLLRKLNEAIRRIKGGTIKYDDAIDVMQNIIIEGKSPIHLSVVKGTHEIKEIEHLIDCDAQPFIPNGWSVESHKKGGLWKFNPNKISLFRSKKQERFIVTGNELMKKVEKLPTMNANVLDYFLDHPELIPKEWKGKAIFFWGTIYRSHIDVLHVRYLGIRDSGCYGNEVSLDYGFNPYNPAALAI